MSDETNPAGCACTWKQSTEEGAVAMPAAMPAGAAAAGLPPTVYFVDATPATTRPAGAPPGDLARLNGVIIGGSVVTLASSALSAYHGYYRNGRSWEWAAVWGLMGLLVPVITPAVGVVQGFARPAVISARPTSARRNPRAVAAASSSSGRRRGRHLRAVASGR